MAHDVSPIQLQSMITCPHCGRQKNETMPTDACRFFYKCEHCQAMLKPKAEDCCVFCSYGTVPCPPRQTGNCEARKLFPAMKEFTGNSGGTSLSKNPSHQIEKHAR